MDLTNKISADIISALPDESLQELNKLLDNNDVSEEQIQEILARSGVDVAGIVKKATKGE